MFGDRDSGAYLVKFSWTGIVRHVMVKGGSSPDDPGLAEYWAERRKRVKPPLDDYTLRLLTRQDGRCPLCGDHLLTADQPPQSPEQWERWWLQVTRKAIAASYLTHHGGPGSPDGEQNTPRTRHLPSRAESPPAQGTSTANLHAPAACLSRMPRRVARTVLRGDRRGNPPVLPGDRFEGQRAGLFRPRVAQRIPRQIPDGKFDELFAALCSHRDRALLAFWISTGARASELPGVLAGGIDPGQQLITVIRKGSRAVQQLPASPDAFVWLRLYQQQVHGLVPAGPADPVWWTLRRPFRALSYPAARAMFGRANHVLGANWTLHDLRHSASYRLARDPQVPLTDVQWILGHAHLSTTELYLNTTPQDAIRDVLAHYERRAAAKDAMPEPSETRLHYRPEALDALFGDSR